jgi:hypothetical protein
MQVTIEIYNPKSLKLLEQLEELNLLKLLFYKDTEVETDIADVDYEMDGTPISDEEFVKTAAITSEEVKNGNYLTTEELMKKLGV